MVNKYYDVGNVVLRVRQREILQSAIYNALEEHNRLLEEHEPKIKEVRDILNNSEPWAILTSKDLWGEIQSVLRHSAKLTGMQEGILLAREKLLEEISK